MGVSASMSGQVVLVKEDFGVTAPEAFRQAWEGGEFADVTLACEDGQQIRAHRVILSSCSPWFRSILTKNPHQHPLILLKGIRHRELQLILGFVYLGRTEVAQEEVEGFLAAASDLQVTALSVDKTKNNLEKETVETESKAVSVKTECLETSEENIVITSKNVAETKENTTLEHRK